MKNRVLLAIVLVGVLFAILLGVIPGGDGRADLVRTRGEDRASEPVATELAAPMETERTFASAPDRAPPAETPSARDPARPTGEGLPFRGQVVDVRTDEPVPSAIARIQSAGSTLDAWTDAEGRFASDDLLAPDFEGIAFFNAHNPAHIRTAPRHELERLPDDGGWLARIRIGPTFRLRLLGADLEQAGPWRLRVVESAPGLPDRATAWLAVVPGDPPWVRFDNPLHEPPERATERVEVQDEAGTLRGEAPIETLVGIHPGLVTVVLAESSARVLGRVVDSEGKPLEHAEVSAIPRSGRVGADGSWASARTDGAGRYAIGGLTPGAHWIHARPRRGQEPQTIEIELPAGDTTAPDLVAPAVIAAGAIEGLLKVEGELDFPVAVVRLRAVDGRPYEHYDVVDTSQQGENLRPCRYGNPFSPEKKGFFEFQQVPEGDYELTVIASDGSRWSPSPLRVRPPRQDLEIVRVDSGGSWTADWLVSDAQTGEPIREFHVQILGSEAWSPELGVPGSFPAAARFRWNVHADGYAMASGTERDLVGEKVRVAEVRLRKGFGARLLLRDARGRFDLQDDDWVGRIAAVEHPPVADVEIRVDGRTVARSDATGAAPLELPERPGRIEVVAPGWTVLGSSRFRDGCIVGEAREVLVWLTR